MPKFVLVKPLLLYLGSWCHLSVEIESLTGIFETFRDPTLYIYIYIYIYIELIYQISAQSETWDITVSEGEVLSNFTYYMILHDF